MNYQQLTGLIIKIVNHFKIFKINFQINLKVQK